MSTVSGLGSPWLTMRQFRRLALAFVLLGADVMAQTEDHYPEYEVPYDGDLLYLHGLVNYAHDLYWQLDWERHLLADNGLRLNVGSVSAEELMTVAELNINQDLNEKWRFQARAYRNEIHHRPNREDNFFVGLERSIFDSSSIFLMVTPDYEKEFIDFHAGYTFYRRERQQYARIGVLLEDALYGTKNELAGEYEQQPIALQWSVRLGTEDWWIFSEGKAGTGFERIFPDAEASPELSQHDRRENLARVKFTRAGSVDSAWSAWIDWYDFRETKLFRQPGFDYEYTNKQLNFAAEYIRTFAERHRLRFLAHYVQVEAGSRGFRAHDYDREDLLGGIFYEYLRSNDSFMISYAFGSPNAEFQRFDDDSASFTLDDYTDKLILGWRYVFSADAQILISVSQEIKNQGFGGGNLQYQMFF